MAAQIDWSPILQRLVGEEGMAVSKAQKKAVKRAAKTSQASKAELKAVLKGFLQRPGSGFQVKDGKLVKAKGAEAHACGGAGAVAAEAGGAGLPPLKKKKKDKPSAAKQEAAANQQQQQREGEQPSGKDGRKRKAQEPAPAADCPAAQQQRQHEQEQQQQEREKKKDKKKLIDAGKKRKAADEAGAQEDQQQQQEGAQSQGAEGQARQEQGAEEGQGAEGQGQQQAESRKRHKRADGSAAEAGSGGGGKRGGGGGSGERTWRESSKRKDVKSGPFSKAEKQTLREAVAEYAAAHGHSTKDFSWLLGNSRSGNKGAWVKIAQALPDRTTKSVWAAGTRIFHEGNYQARGRRGGRRGGRGCLGRRARGAGRGGAAWARTPARGGSRRWRLAAGSAARARPHAGGSVHSPLALLAWRQCLAARVPPCARAQGKWTPEQDEQLRQLVREHGHKWKTIGPALGRMPAACQDRWKEIRLGDSRRKGPWKLDEVEKLREAVQDVLDARAEAEREGGGAERGEGGGAGAEAAAGGEEGGAGGGGGPVNRRGVLDDIDWGLVSERVGTRSNVQCLDKWYNQVSSSMVARGEWGSGDDRRLLRSVYAGVIAGATHDFELDWSQLVKGRGPQQARRRWRLMVKVVPDHRDMEFAGLVDALVDRYLPKLKQQAAAAAEQEQQQRGKGQQGEA
eukprot:scaffold1.g5250.t1